MKNVLQLYHKDREIIFPVSKIYNGGYAGRDQAAVKAHIDELAKIGVPAPTRTPTLYPISNYLATTDRWIQVQHGKTSGEIEYALLFCKGKIYVTVASDHTDRDLENYSVPMSKQAYPNVLAPEVWDISDVKDHWDELVIRCTVIKGGNKTLYQDTKLSSLMHYSMWLQKIADIDQDLDGTILLSGTPATIGGALIFADNYYLEMEDPVLGLKITHSYNVEVLKEGIK